MTRQPAPAHVRPPDRRVTPRAGVRYSSLHHQILGFAMGGLLRLHERIQLDGPARWDLSINGDLASPAAFVAFGELVVAGLIDAVDDWPLPTDHGRGVIRRWNVEQGLVERAGGAM